MLPWEHQDFRWNVENPVIPVITQEFIAQPWTWGNVSGDGFWWNLEQPGVFRIYQIDIDPDYYGWESLILNEKYIPQDVLLKLGWKSMEIKHNENFDWWIFQPTKKLYNWGTHFRRIESCCHIPSLHEFERRIKEHFEMFPPENNVWKSLPVNPFLKTIWHAIWGIWLVSSPNLDELRFQFHLHAFKNFIPESLQWVDCFGNTWFHECAKTIHTLDGWNAAIILATGIWGKDKNTFPRNIEMETPWDILNKRRFDKGAPTWIESWFDAQEMSPTSTLLQ